MMYELSYLTFTDLTVCFFCSIQIYEGSSLMVRVGEFLAILTLSRAKKHSLVHYQKWTSPTEPSRVAFGRDQGLSLSLL